MQTNIETYLTNIDLLAQEWREYFTSELAIPFSNAMAEVTKHVVELYRRDMAVDFFTPHDEYHSYRVENICKTMIKGQNIYLDDFEKFILFFSVWTHDIGMIEWISQAEISDYTVRARRERHEEISAIYVSKDDVLREKLKISGINQNLIHAIVNTSNIVVKFHRSKHRIMSCPEFRYVNNGQVNSRLIASILRLADTLDVDANRFDTKRYKLLQTMEFDRYSRQHWLKILVTSSVRLNFEERIIQIHIDLPQRENKEKSRSNRTEYKASIEKNEESKRRLVQVIRDNIYNDIKELKAVFRKNNYTYFDDVEVVTHECPGYTPDRANEIWGILGDLDVVLSPNSSKVISRSEESIDAFINSSFENMRFSTVLGHAEQFLLHLRTVQKDRPCHVGLSKVITGFDEVLGNYRLQPDGIIVEHPTSKIIELKDRLSAFVKEIRKLHVIESSHIAKVSQNAGHELSRFLAEKFREEKYKISDLEYVFLFGYSDTVISFLEHNGKKSSIKIFVFECSSKRKFSSYGGLEYHDGIRYSLELSKVGFEKICLLPDTSLSNLLNDPEADKLFDNDKDNMDKKSTSAEKLFTNKNSMMLIGANGIDSELNCGHTSGHLMMMRTILSYKEHIPIVVVASKYKCLNKELDWKVHLVREGTDWLTGDRDVLEDLAERNIRIVNYREDKIEKNLIDAFVLFAPPSNDTSSDTYINISAGSRNYSGLSMP